MWLALRWLTVAVLLASPLLVVRAARPAAEDRPWMEPMRRVHAQFTGRKGTFAQFGDSITVTAAFWGPLAYERRLASPAMERAFQTVKARLQPECWSQWKGPRYGSEGGQTARWASQHVGEWLAQLNPEVALVMFGTNDLGSVPVDEYRTTLTDVIRRCLNNGTVVILSTIPPRHGFEEKSAAYAAAEREIARELNLPLIDFYAEILKRRPQDWDGALPQFSQFQGYEVPTLISRDGVHPSLPKADQNDYSEEALSRCGYSLRNYLALMKYVEVVEALGAAPTPGAASAPPQQSWWPKAPPLPPPAGETIRAASVDELCAAAAKVKPQGTILLADGTYRLSKPLEIRTDGVTVRGASGHREAAVLDGGGTQGELVWLTRCSDVTIADLTVQNARWNGIKLNSETGVQRARIYNCVLHNIWQRAVKGVRVPPEGRERLRPAGCRVEYCLFRNDRAKQFADDPADTPHNFGGNYIGGIDVMYPRGWVIANNVFLGVQGRTHEARGAVFLWHDAQDCVVERNVIVDCDSGICLGNSSPGDTPLHASRMIVRNNFIARAPENGILADYTRDCKILHNTVQDPGSRLGRLIRVVHDADGLLIANNLISGPAIRNESSSRIEVRDNVQRDVTSLFVDPAAGNLRLAVAALDAIPRVPRLAEVPADIDGTARPERTMPGAWEPAR